MSPHLIRNRQITGEMTLRAQRPCGIQWKDGNVDLKADGREGFVTYGLESEQGGFVEQKKCKFYVLRDLIAKAPEIDTIFSLGGREDRWKLKGIISGISPHDLLWIFDCIEEHS